MMIYRSFSENCKIYVSENKIKPLTHLYNLSLKEGTFPNKLKLIVVKPLLKTGDTSSVNNYRLIYMLNNFAKILERIMKGRSIKFLENNKMLFKNHQYGFRPALEQKMPSTVRVNSYTI